MVEKEICRFEIKYRKILVKKLKSVERSLEKAVEAEKSKKEERINEIQKYATEEEIQEAYGYGEITDDERRILLGDLEIKASGITPKKAALDELRDIIRMLTSEIDYYEWETLSEKRKEEIKESNEEYKRKVKQLATQYGGN